MSVPFGCNVEDSNAVSYTTELFIPGPNWLAEVAILNARASQSTNLHIGAKTHDLIHQKRLSLSSEFGLNSFESYHQISR